MAERPSLSPGSPRTTSPRRSPQLTPRKSAMMQRSFLGGEIEGGDTSSPFRSVRQSFSADSSFILRQSLSADGSLTGSSTSPKRRSPQRDSVSSFHRPMSPRSPQNLVTPEQLEKLADRYPFHEFELEQLLGCYETSSLRLEQREKSQSQDSGVAGRCNGGNHEMSAAAAAAAVAASITAPKDVLAMLALSSRKIFSREDTIRRVSFCEERVLPTGFADRFKAALTAPAFVTFPIEGVEADVEDFLEGMAGCVGRRGPRQVLQVIYDCCCHEGTSEESGQPAAASGSSEAEAADLVGLCHRLSVASSVLASSALDTASSSILSGIEAGEEEDGGGGGPRTASSSSFLAPPSALVESLLKASRSWEVPSSPGKSTVSRRTFVGWVDATAPVLASTLPTFVQNLVFLDGNHPMAPTPFMLPEIRYEKSAFFEGTTNSQSLFCLACMCPEMGGKWHRLYSYDSSGSSFSMLYSAIVGYDGPAVFLIKAVGGGSFGAFTSCQWKESGSFFGDMDSFLFQLDPCVGVYRPEGSSSNFLYCNPESRSRVSQSRAHGIGFGGDANGPRLFLAESPDEPCTASAYDTTYQQGELMCDGCKVGERFKIEHLEVWGVGGEDNIEAGLKARDMKREVKEANMMKVRTVVDKAAFLDDFTSGIMDCKLWDHRAQARGRASFNVDEKHGGYWREEEEEQGELSHKFFGSFD